MSEAMNYKLPPLPEVMREHLSYFTNDAQSELTQAIEAYAIAAIEAQGVPDVDALAQFIREIDGAHRFGAGALAERICAWLASAPPAPQAKPQPLSDEQIKEITRALMPCTAGTVARAVEAAHGITKE